MRRVRSPYVAEVIDADLAGDMPYIVTRYVPGRTLEQVVTESGPLPPPALARLACGLADALAAVHAAGVVHRDLKPSNVMLLDELPVVIDFGIAQGPDATRLTMTGMFMGTPGYLAPEVIEGQPSSEASDVHAWAATVAFAATGHPPFGSGGYEAIFYRIVNGQPDLTGAPASLLPLLAAALARDPGLRPPAAQLSAQAAALAPGGVRPGGGPGRRRAGEPVHRGPGDQRRPGSRRPAGGRRRAGRPRRPQRRRRGASAPPGGHPAAAGDPPGARRLRRRAAAGAVRARPGPAGPARSRRPGTARSRRLPPGPAAARPSPRRPARSPAPRQPGAAAKSTLAFGDGGRDAAGRGGHQRGPAGGRRAERAGPDHLAAAPAS